MSKKVDVSFMKFVADDAEWKREIEDCGDKQICIIDVYTNMWGPCEMIAGHFNNFFYDLGETYGLKFVRASSDKISVLKEYVGASQPMFLFYLSGGEVAKVTGCNLPAILSIIKEQAPKLA